MPPKLTLQEQLRRLHDSCETLVRAGDPIVDPFREAIAAQKRGSYMQLARELLKSGNQGRSITAADLNTALVSFGLKLRRDDVDRLHRMLDKSGKGSLTAEEILRGIRPEMSMPRRDVVLQAFALLDPEKRGSVPLDEMLSLFDVTQHPAVICGASTPDSVFAEFSQDWKNRPLAVSGYVSQAEFVEYYSNMSANMVPDDYFELTVRNSWHVFGGEGLARGSACAKADVLFDDGRRGVYEVRNDLRVNRNDIDQIKKMLVSQGLKNIKSLSIVQSSSNPS